MEQATQAIQYLLSVPTEVYVTVLGALGVSILTQVSKKLLSLENDKTVMTVFTAISFLFSGVEYLATASHLPPSIMGVSTASIMGIATLLYRVVVKPADEFVSAVQAYKTQVVTKVEDITDQPTTQPTPLVPPTISEVLPAPALQPATTEPATVQPVADF